MGQYYLAVNLDKKQFIKAHDYNCGLKLMEHSYLGNVLMNIVEQLLSKTGDWYKNHIVWAGDYADKEKDNEENIFHIAEETYTRIIPKKEKNNHDDNYYYRLNYLYLINHTKKEIIDLSKIKPDKDGYKIHPLPLLTAEGNGRGGGDYYGADNRVGIWARDIISIENDLIADYKLIDGQFIE